MAGKWTRPTSCSLLRRLSAGLPRLRWPLTSWPTCWRTRCGSAASVGYKDIANAPHSLNVAWHGRIRLNKFAQARHLHVQAAVKGLELAATRQLRQFFAGKRLARVAHQSFEHGKFA